MTTTSTIPSQSWIDKNQKHIVNSIDQICVLLKKYIKQIEKTRKTPTTSDQASVIDNNDEKEEQITQREIDDQQQALLSHNPEESFPLSSSSLPPSSAPPALENICNLFSLTKFERSILLLCAGVELNTEVAHLCAKAHGNPNSAYPTFGLSLAALPEAHWSALTPMSPLRRFRLIKLNNSNSYPQMPLTSTPLQIEERVLHYLTGISYFEPQLRGMVRPARENAAIVDSHKRLLELIIVAWQGDGTRVKEGGEREANGIENEKKLAVIGLWGIDESSKLVIARQACANIGLGLCYIPAELVPSKAEEREFFAQLWSREAALMESGLYISAEDIEMPLQRSITQLVATGDIPGPIFLGTREQTILNCSHISLEVKKPTKAEQRNLWKSYLDEELPQNADADTESNEIVIRRLASQFDLNAYSIQEVVRKTLLQAKNDYGHARNEGKDEDDNLVANRLSKVLWDSSRALTMPKLAELAQRIIPKATMNDLVLPAREKEMLHEIAIHVSQRDKVYEEWGFEEASSRGLGITVLFSGNSGTGKTMAAEALANYLHLDLFRIDLSAVVSKYIGETEKNLRKVFDAAEDGGAIILCDEADAIFGKRTDVLNSHDRFANNEVAYLLQLMESYRGLAILTTNMKNSIDHAFMRRIRFILNFPFPDEKSRAEIWKCILPPKMPTANNLQLERLARLNIAGGNIRNIAMTASFLAADEEVPVNMSHLKRAVQNEFIKLERPLTQSELGDWH
jgi:AAA+ superfamily predicted ATPase